MTNASRALAAVPQRGNGGQQTCPHCKQPWLHRSDADHRMLWAIIHRAFDNWPEQHEFCPMDANELYGWLLIKAGHCASGEVKDRDINAIRKSAHTFFDLCGESEHPIYYVDLTPTRNGVVVTIPKSLSYKKAGKRKFEDVRSRVYEVIESVLQVPVEQLKHEARNQ